jgi:ankyrin repeat protein
VKALLELNSDVNAVSGDDGSTPLHLAALTGSEACVDVLIQHGVIFYSLFEHELLE